MEDYDYAHSLFMYSSTHKGLLRKVGRGSAKAGEKAGGDNGLGYLRVNFKGKLRLVSHVVWLMQTGAWPARQLDHINQDSQDDRFENLREVSQSWNVQNQDGPKKGNKTGYRGVVQREGLYHAYIVVDGKQKWLGGFPQALQASEAYETARKELHPGVIA